MKLRLSVIGIGAGDPRYVTIQAIEAMNRAKAFFIPGKGDEKAGLARLRHEIIEKYVRGQNFRIVPFQVPERKISETDYKGSITAWRAEVEAVYRRLLTEELNQNEEGAFLVWGDPTLYDGTLRILDDLNAGGVLEIDYEIVPGISSVQALAARHKVPMNPTGEPVTITTGRRLAGGLPDDAGNVMVMLDAKNAFTGIDPDMVIHWGAYIGTPDEILISGRLGDVRDDIVRAWTEAREKHGWIMDTYMLSRPGEDGGAS